MPATLGYTVSQVTLGLHFPGTLLLAQYPTEDDSPQKLALVPECLLTAGPYTENLGRSFLADGPDSFLEPHLSK